MPESNFRVEKSVMEDSIRNGMDGGDRDETNRILLEPYTYIVQMPGKQIRSKLVQAFNLWMKIPEDKLMIISEVMQMLHNASLLVDDIEDSSTLRRGLPVAHHIYGVPSTINSANYVYFLALEKMLTLGHPEAPMVFTQQLLELHRGQGLEIYWRDHYRCPTEEEYKKMVIQKTGGLFMLAIRLMQLFSTCKADFRPLTEILGLMFQIRDDYCNLVDADYADSKSYCEDLTEGKFSFPIIHGIRSEYPASSISNVVRQRTEDVNVKKYCVDCLTKLGSLEYTKTYLKELDNRARGLIADLGGNDVLLKFLDDTYVVKSVISDAPK
ncbi:Geranylgeranyl pyrophosphate synthase [Hypsibius exemplaris]|uniref:Geranylgeranyl pyrophosphate synthase n=1 Tax=Hypsibius exemplaris TaxID=2072580 RepID=A0A1W0XCT6_HYPEX|nr:Geranylgeranyl pyrophosphate synthase [Hypsibius exemplaris]